MVKRPHRKSIGTRLGLAVLGLLSLTLRPGARELDPSSIVEGRFVHKGWQVYRLVVPRGTSLELRVEQLGVDVQVSLFDPRNELVLSVDTPNGDQGEEAVVAVPPLPGNHRLLITAAPQFEGGRYRVRFEHFRQATARDHQRFIAARSYNQGLRSYSQELQQKPRDPAGLQATLFLLKGALSFWQQAGDDRNAAWALRSIGDVHGALGESGPQLGAYQQSSEVAREAGALRLAALMSYRIGDIHREERRCKKALPHLERAANLFEELQDLSRQARSLGRIASCHHYSGALQEAARFFKRAQRLFEQANELESSATAQSNAGDMYLKLGDIQLAVDEFLSARDAHEALGNSYQEAVDLTRIGRAYRRQGKLEDSLLQLRRADLALQDSGRRRKQRPKAILLAELGQTLFKLERLVPALEAYSEALGILQGLRAPDIEGITRVNLGWLHEVAGRPAEAIIEHQKALSLLEPLGDRYGQASAWIGLARAERKRNNLTVAERHARRAIALVEALRSESDDQVTKASYFATKRGYYGLLIEALLELAVSDPDSGHVESALEFSERSRFRSLVDLLSEAGEGLALQESPELARARQRLRAKDLERFEIGQLAGRSREQKRIDRELQQAVHDLRDVVAQLRCCNQRNEKLEVASFEGIQGLLGQDTQLLEFFLGKEASYVWLLSSDSVASYKLASRELLEPLARRTHLALREGYSSRFRAQTDQLLAQLGEQLLGQVGPQLEKKRLIVVADGALHYVPFAALRLPSALGEFRYLAEDHEIIHLPSASVLGALRQNLAGREPAAKTLAVIGDPVFSMDAPRSDSKSSSGASAQPNEWSELVWASEEARKVLSWTGTDQELAALGFDANLDLVRSGVLRDYQIVHFVTHGRLSTDYPELSALVLSLVDHTGQPREGMLYAHEIYNLDLTADLVVLSACETALGKEIRGEGLINMTRGFLYAGAKSVIVSLWEVDDRATAELMQRLYKRLLDSGLDPAEALQQTQRSMIHDPQFASPYFWSGFVLQGDWR